jgi:hypothetical protein
VRSKTAKGKSFLQHNHLSCLLIINTVDACFASCFLDYFPISSISKHCYYANLVRTPHVEQQCEKKTRLTWPFQSIIKCYGEKYPILLTSRTRHCYGAMVGRLVADRTFIFMFSDARSPLADSAGFSNVAMRQWLHDTTLLICWFTVEEPIVSRC